MEPSPLVPSDLLRIVLRERLKPYRLTYREEQIVDLVLQGLTNKAIAAGCRITEQTVKDHLKHVYRKMGVHQRTAAIAKLLQS
jgi:DNA-binding NarL/FixJ family response regulator